MLPFMPYQLRATYDWIVDSDCTPLLEVDLQAPGCVTPPLDDIQEANAFVLADDVVDNLVIGPDFISFFILDGPDEGSYRLPIGAVLSLSAHETGFGMFLLANGKIDGDFQPAPSDGRPNLRLVKSDKPN